MGAVQFETPVASLVCLPRVFSFPFQMTNASRLVARSFDRRYHKTPHMRIYFTHGIDSDRKCSNFAWREENEVEPSLTMHQWSFVKMG
ncbi:hypothetical protein CEXT_50741 [Caerostris extrusa]|uniref:Uncharacterized protein n=1 Tax=Caerostris extrusa TaxID=172846 RepID=A0AAV4WF88_CAEEX|nr:hypothetical protein CEXT_50741 [Caerostris extrusa]